MARISVEQTVLTDLRYQTLGRIFRKEKRWARGVMMEVWNQCQELETHTLSRQDILDLCPDIKGFADALIAASLADEQEDGSLYIRGTKGRIEWLGKLRGNARFGALGGPSGVKGGRPKQTPIRGLEETPIRGLENNPPPAPAPAPAPSLSITINCITSTRLCTLNILGATPNRGIGTCTQTPAAFAGCSSSWLTANAAGTTSFSWSPNCGTYGLAAPCTIA